MICGCRLSAVDTEYVNNNEGSSAVPHVNYAKFPCQCGKIMYSTYMLTLLLCDGHNYLIKSDKQLLHSTCV